MATKTTSQSQQKQKTNPVDPFGWMGMYQKQVETTAAMFESVHEATFARTRSNIEASTSLLLDTIDYAEKLSNEWRKLAVETTQSLQHAAERA